MTLTAGRDTTFENRMGHDYCISAMHSFSSVRGKVF